MLNKAILMGRLVADPDLRQTSNGIDVCTFRIAVDRNYGKDHERQTDFIDIVTWRSTAEFVSRYFSKGKMIVVEGSIQTRNYEDKNGNKRTAVEVVANSVLFGESKNAARSNENAGLQKQPVHSSAPVSYTSGSFTDIDVGDSEDLPF